MEQYRTECNVMYYDFDYKTAYYVADNDLLDFYSHYNRLINNGHKICFMEKKKDIGPLIVDIDFMLQGPDRQYTKKHIEIIVKELIQCCSEYPNTCKNDTMIIVEEKSCPVYKPNTGKYKDGINIILSAPFDQRAREHILNHLRCKSKDKKWFYDMLLDDKITGDNIFDVEQTFYPLYGSEKSGSSYKITHIYNYDMTEQDITQYSTLQKIIMCSTRKYNKCGFNIFSDISNAHKNKNTDQSNHEFPTIYV